MIVLCGILNFHNFDEISSKRNNKFSLNLGRFSCKDLFFAFN